MREDSRAAELQKLPCPVVDAVRIFNLDRQAVVCTLIDEAEIPAGGQLGWCACVAGCGRLSDQGFGFKQVGVGDAEAVCAAARRSRRQAPPGRRPLGPASSSSQISLSLERIRRQGGGGKTRRCIYALTSTRLLHETLDLFVTREAADAELREILLDETDWKEVLRCPDGTRRAGRLGQLGQIKAVDWLVNGDSPSLPVTITHGPTTTDLRRNASPLVAMSLG